MKTILNYLDDLKEKNGSDYRTAKLLGITKESVSQARKRTTVADETAIKMADILEIDREEVLIAAAIARSNNDEVKRTWENISKLSGIAASVVMTCILTTNEVEAGANQAFNNNVHVIHYAKSYIGALAAQKAPSKRVITVI